MSDNRPTVRNYAGVHRVDAGCEVCDHWAELDLPALLAAGKGDIPLVELNLRCQACGSNRVDIKVSGRSYPLGSQNPALRSLYFGTTDGLPPGDPGGGITGIDAPALGGGLMVIPGSTFGGMIVFSRASRWPEPPSTGAIRSGGGEGALGGASWGSEGFTGGGFCAIAGAVMQTNAMTESVLNMSERSCICVVLNRRLAARSPTLAAT